MKIRENDFILNIQQFVIILKCLRYSLDLRYSLHLTFYCIIFNIFNIFAEQLFAPWHSVQKYRISVQL